MNAQKEISKRARPTCRYLLYFVQQEAVGWLA
jgi:hypothetical protein